MCIFCKIINKEIPSESIISNDDFIVLNDLHPKAKTHLLIVPRKHIETITDLEDNDSDLIWKMFLLARDIAKQRWIDGYRLQFNVGKWWWQEVFHIHLHFLAN